MAKRLTAAQMESRYEEFGEASEHLRMDWTNKPLEAVEGEIMADWLHAQSTGLPSSPLSTVRFVKLRKQDL